MLKSCKDVCQRVTVAGYIVVTYAVVADDGSKTYRQHRHCACTFTPAAYRIGKMVRGWARYDLTDYGALLRVPHFRYVRPDGLVSAEYVNAY